MTSVAGFASGCSGSTPPRRRSPDLRSAAGAQKPPSSPRPPWWGNASRSSRTHPKTNATATAALTYLDKADGWDYSVEAARAGVAHSYVYASVPVARYAQIDAAQQEAQAAGRGLWGPPCFGHTDSIRK